ncbi:MAG TPA: Shedu anti-phage system protein SduA domain-containing protein [Solirubrobacteraceae bacterium]
MNLADQILDDCPEDKRPALLLTDRDDVDEGARTTDRSYVVVVNLPRYIANADRANAAAAYLAKRLGRGLTRARSFSERSAADAEAASRWLDEHLDAATLARWAGNREDRLSLLRRIGTGRQETGGDAERAIDALEALEELHPDVAETVAALVRTGADPEIRRGLLEALTSDAVGRYAMAEILHARVAERLADARAAADEFDELLTTSGETKVQHFLESHPWLLGLDYAQIRARQQVVRGAIDFLLERFDGFHDLLELKSPGDAIFERHGGGDIESPSAFRLSRPLALALAQVHAYRDTLSEDVTHERFYGLPHTREPRISILIGMAADLTDQEARILRELNCSLHRVEVVPFDVVADRAHAMVQNVERYLLVADEETRRDD